MNDKFLKVAINRSDEWVKPFNEADMSNPLKGPTIETVTLQYTNAVNLFMKEVNQEYYSIIDNSKGRLEPKFIIIGKKAYEELYAYYQINCIDSLDTFMGLILLVDGSKIDMSFKILCDPKDEFFKRKY